MALPTRPLTNLASRTASSRASATEITVVATANTVVLKKASRKLSSFSRFVKLSSPTNFSAGLMSSQSKRLMTSA
jgi:hypothetical protein